MTTLIASAALYLFASGACTGIIGVLSLAIRREDEHLTLTSEATSHLTPGRTLAERRGRSRSAPLGAAF